MTILLNICLLFINDVLIWGEGGGIRKQTIHTKIVHLYEKLHIRGEEGVWKHWKNAAVIYKCSLKKHGKLLEKLDCKIF